MLSFLNKFFNLKIENLCKKLGMIFPSFFSKHLLDLEFAQLYLQLRPQQLQL